MAATPIPPILDKDRYVRYDPVAVTTDFDVPFPYFGTDASELLVLVGGLKTTAFAVLSKSAGSLANAVLPVEDAIVRLNDGVSGSSVEIYGSIRPRRTVQATAAFSTRDFNFVFSYVVATLREMWAQFTRAIQVPVGETPVIFPTSAARAGKVLGFDALGVPKVFAPIAGGVVGADNIIHGAVTRNAIADDALNGISIGGTKPAPGAFTTLSANARLNISTNDPAVIVATNTQTTADGSSDARLFLSARNGSVGHAEFGQRGATGDAYIWNSGYQWSFQADGGLRTQGGAYLYNDGNLYLTSGGLNTDLITILGRSKSIRLGGIGIISQHENTSSEITYYTPTGCVVTGFTTWSWGNSIGARILTDIRYRQLQQTDIFGNWYAISQV